MMIRSPKLLAAAEGQSCVNCGAADGTVVAAHYSGMRSHALGMGRGHKVHDIATAELCTRCHSAFDGNQIGDHPDREMRRIDKSEQFLFLVLQTIIRRIQRGEVRL